MALMASALVVAGGVAVAGSGPRIIASVPVGRAPSGVAVDPTLHRVYAFNFSDQTVSVIDESGDAETGKVTAKIYVGLADCCYDGDSLAFVGMTVDPSNHNVYVVFYYYTGPDLSFGSDIMAVIDESGDAKNGQVTDVPLDFPPTAIAVDPSTHNVYLTSFYSGATETVIDESGDANDNKVIGTITIGADPYPYPTALAIDPSRHTLYVAATVYSGGNDRGMLSVIDLSDHGTAGKVTATIPIGEYAGSVAVDPGTHDVYVANTLSNTVSLIDESGDAHNGKVTSTVSVGPSPDALTVDTSTHNVYVPDATENSISVIDGTPGPHQGSVVATVAGGASPQAVAADPSMHLLFVADSGDNTVSVLSTAPGEADLAMRISGPDQLAQGGKFTERITVTNNGPSPAIDLVTNLLIPEGLTWTAAPGAVIQAGTLVWEDTSLSPQSQITYVVTYTVADGVHETASIGGVTESDVYDPNPSNNVAVSTVKLS